MGENIYYSSFVLETHHMILWQTKDDTGIIYKMALKASFNVENIWTWQLDFNDHSVWSGEEIKREMQQCTEKKKVISSRCHIWCLLSLQEFVFKR